MQQTEESKSRERTGSMLFVAALTFGAALRLGLYLKTQWTIDDGLIGFRFGEQFAAGHGLVYNAGERVSCNTSVLHTFLLGLAGLIGLPIPTFARVLGIGSDIATALM